MAKHKAGDVTWFGPSIEDDDNDGDDYTHPWHPALPAIAEWLQKYPDVIDHLRGELMRVSAERRIDANLYATAAMGHQYSDVDRLCITALRVASSFLELANGLDNADGD